MSAPRLINLYDLTREQLRLQLVRWELNPVHVARLWNYLYLELAASLDAMPELPPKLRARLAAETQLGVLPTALETASSDGFTQKYLLALNDAEKIETVLMRFTGRVTACVSSQVGCAMGCVFCATGQMGYTRHLTPGEIVAQAVHVARALRTARNPQRLRNIVLMGMGEPLHNYDAVMTAIDILRDETGLALGAERITLSTVGVCRGSCASRPKNARCTSRSHFTLRRKQSAPPSCPPPKNGRSTNSWPPAARTARRPDAGSFTSGR